MKTTTTHSKLRGFLLICAAMYSSTILACSPCGALSNVTQNLVGTDLELTFTSNAGWNCCYNVQIEIVCASSAFTGVANYSSAQICIGGGGGASQTNPTPTPYPLTVLDLSSFCPGLYKWRATETGCGIYTAEFQFEIVGASPIVLDLVTSADTICEGDNAQFTATATGGCNNGTMSYAWTPAAGLSNPNIANPIASPAASTTYTCTVTESGSCAVPQTGDLIVVVNPLPTATVDGTVALCQGEPSPTITFIGAGGTPPYLINYTLNGVAQTGVVTTGNTYTITVPTDTPGTYTYAIVDVQESSSSQCTQAQIGEAVVTVYALPIIDAGLDQEICEPNPNSPSEITLNGGGGVSYVWDNGVTNGVAFIPPLGETLYTVIGTDANGCSSTDQVTVWSYPQPTADGSANLTFGNVPVSVDFSNFSSDADSYIWDFGDGNTQPTNSLNGVSHTYTTPGVYTVTLTASNGICYDVWTIEVEVIPPMIVTPPNIFTPNGDGVNDEYFVNVQYGEKFEAIVLNRWGNYITSFTHMNQGWNGMSNGAVLNDGVYYIKYKATDYAGHEIEGHTYFNLVR